MTTRQLLEAVLWVGLVWGVLAVLGGLVWRSMMQAGRVWDIDDERPDVQPTIDAHGPHEARPKGERWR